MLLADSHPESQQILIHAPFGRDAKLIRSELEAAGFRASICLSMDQLCSAMDQAAGCALIAEEGLTGSAVKCLLESLAKQPPWSDFPIIVMTSGGASTRSSRQRLNLITPLGNVTLLERPLRPETLTSSMRASLRARRHQYQLREHLMLIGASGKALRESEARFRFLSELGDATRLVSAPEDVTAVVARRLGAHLGASRCAYASVDSEAREIHILHDFTTQGLRSTVGRYLLSSFGPQAERELKAGRNLILHDVRQELASGAGREMFLALEIEAIICCPLIKDGRLAAMMAVHQSVPRHWTEDDVELVQEVVERCWAYIERERLVDELAGNNLVLHRTNRDLIRVNRELEEFAYVASHDLQEPLRMVKIYTQLILKHLDLSDRTLDHYADFVQQGAERMEELIRDLLSFSRAVHTESPVIGTANLTTSLAEALAVLKTRIAENSAEIHAPCLPLVRGDTPQLSHVFQNLIANSIKYRKTTQKPVIEISAEQDGQEWVIAVKDNGIGFDQIYAERIFGLFKRLHKDEYPGTGLGLAICQRIVERYGGRMWAISEPGLGSTFYFALPVPDELAAPA